MIYFLNKIPLKIRLQQPLIILFFVATLLLTSLYFSNDVSATHLSEEMKWQLLFISSKGCSLHNYQMMAIYDEITKKYLELYQLENSNYDSLCFPEAEYLSDFQSPPDLDLLILVYDRDLGEKLLHSQKMGGLFSHNGSDRRLNHVIIVCDCSNFYYSDPVWILSHELSHFVLYSRNYEMSVIEDLIHSNDERYDNCIAGGLLCPEVVTKLETDSSSRLFSVMPIIDLKPNDNNEMSNQDDNVGTNVVGLTKMITKWWAAGKITDGDYANAVGYLVDEKMLTSPKQSEIVLAEEPFDNSVTWEDKFSEINNNYWARSLKDESQNANSPTGLKNLVNGNPSTSVSPIILGLPEWFKTTASWWAQDKITNKEFRTNIQYLVNAGIIRSQVSEVLQGVVNNEDSLVDSSLLTIVADVESFSVSKYFQNEDSSMLINKLNKARDDFKSFNHNKGCNNIDDFVELVSVMVDQGKLSEKKGQSLINSADIIKLNFC